MKQIKHKIIFLILVFSFNLNADVLKVAVIDTGLSDKAKNLIPLCKNGHKSFVSNTIEETINHGTHISYTIHEQVKFLPVKDKYCQLILKVFDKDQKISPIEATTLAIEYSIKNKVKIINYSAGGTLFSKQEREAFKKALDLGIIIVVSAGNNGSILIKDSVNETSHYYPAMYDSRIIVVGNLSSKERSISSNYGPLVKHWEVGTNIFGLQMGGVYGPMSGTSQAAAVKTGKIIRNYLLNSSQKR
jgi:subtilisin family serine protease